MVDDERTIREQLALILQLGSQGTIDVVGKAGDGAEALELVSTLRPTVVLMDIRMDGMDGIEATCRIASLPEPPGVVMVTGESDDDLLRLAVAAGASGFVRKTSSPPEYVQAILQVAMGGTGFTTQTMSELLTDYRAMTRPADEGLTRARAALSRLSERELAIATDLAKGYIQKEIAHRQRVAPSTVKTHIENIREKLGVNTTQEVIALVGRSGILD